MVSKRDYYEVLEVSRDSDGEEIKRSYRKLALKYHPDRNSGDEEAARIFKECTEAYEVLSNPEKKQVYDRYGHDGLAGMGGMGGGGAETIFDAFDDFLGGIFGDRGKGRRGPSRGSDLLFEMQIDLMEAARGVKKNITIPRQENCDSCRGTGAESSSDLVTCRQCNGQGVVVMAQGFFRVQQTCRSCAGRGQTIKNACKDCRGSGRTRVERTLEIAIPPGAATGMRLALRGEGEAGSPGGPRGNLIVEIEVERHHLFQRDGDHLICQVPITFSQAALGGTIEVPTLDGPLQQTLKRGIQSGETIRIAGKGIPNIKTARPGDLIVIVKVETPRKLTKRQEELLRELAELDHKHVSPERKSFFEQLKEFFTGTEDQSETSDKEVSS